MPDAPTLDIETLLETGAVGLKVDGEGKLILETYINKTPNVFKAFDHTGGKQQPTSARKPDNSEPDPPEELDQS